MHIIKHFLTITKHRHQVIKMGFKVGIFFQCLRHDLSKYSPEEFFKGAKYFQGDKSPNDLERKTNGYSLAWMHHKGRNKHHFEYWNDVSLITHRYNEPVRMPIKYVKEMFCDRVAACKIYQKEKYKDDSALNYFIQKKSSYSLMEDGTKKLLESWLILLSQKGEKEACRIIKNIKEYPSEI